MLVPGLSGPVLAEANADPQDVGSLKIAKSVIVDDGKRMPTALGAADSAADETDDAPPFVEPAAGYRITYECSDGTKGEVRLKSDQTKQIDGIAAGSTCSVIEDAGTAQVPAYSLEVFDPGEDGVRIVKGTVVDADVLNYYVPLRGGFEVSKTVTGEAAGKADGRTFTITHSCTDATGRTVDGTVEVTPGQPQWVEVYAGTCVIKEKDASIEGTSLTTTYAVDGGAPSPDSATVVVARNGDIPAVQVTNTYSDKPPAPAPNPSPKPSEPAPSAAPNTDDNPSAPAPTKAPAPSTEPTPTSPGGASLSATPEPAPATPLPPASPGEGPAGPGGPTGLGGGSTDPGGLARTGSDAAAPALLAAVLTAAGVTAILNRRRTRAEAGIR